LIPSHFEFSRQSFVHVPLAHVAAHVVESAQSKAQMFPVHVALHFALSRHLMEHVPLRHCNEQLLDLSHSTWQMPVVQRNAHVSVSLHVQLFPHSLTVVPLSVPVLPDDDAPESVVVLPELELAVPLDDDPVPFPIVQS